MNPREAAHARDGGARPIAAGGLYFGLVFTAGFALGTLRELVVRPVVGSETWAVVIESPLMLAASVLTAGWVCRRMHVHARTRASAVMGVVALSLLLAAELAMWPLVRKQPLSEWIAHYATAPGVIAAALFAVFAVLPWLRGGGNRSLAQ